MSLLRIGRCLWLAAAVLLGQGNTIRVDVNLIQIDVTVVDKSGGRVTGLGLDDFEVYQDGKRQRLQDVTWMGRGQGEGQKRTNHTTAVFLDDFHLSFESTSAVQKALLEFSSQHVRSGDQIALFPASSELGMMKRFSSDKGELAAAVSDFKFLPWSTLQSGTARASLNTLDSIVMALGDLPGRKSLIFISDQFAFTEVVNANETVKGFN